MASWENLTGCGPDDFCLEHGYEFMRSRIGDPIPYCAECERITYDQAMAREHGPDFNRER